MAQQLVRRLIRLFWMLSWELLLSIDVIMKLSAKCHKVEFGLGSRIYGRSQNRDLVANAFFVCRSIVASLHSALVLFRNSRTPSMVSFFRFSIPCS